MRVYELSSYLQSNFNYQFFNNQFPATPNVNIGLARIFPNPTNSRQVNRLNAQALLKTDDMQAGEAKAWEIYEAMRTKGEFNIGATEVVLCLASQPEFIKTTDDTEFLFSVNFQFITNQ